MANESSTGKSLLLVVLLITFFQPGLLSATPHFDSVRSVGLLTEKSFLEVAPEEKSAGRVSFFGTLDPEISAKGAVKTFTVRVINKPSVPSSGDWFKPERKNSSEKFDVAGKIFARPVVGRVSSPFGNRRHPKTNAVRFHSGVDIVAPRGTPVASRLAGKVTFAGWRRGYGLVVVVSHSNGLDTVYAHCSKIAVKVGQSVNTGQRIGYVGNTGVATGSHLHFEVRRDGQVRNPLRYVNM
jgi:murein DD-endopeptidase MepM/ murein hydrolase activator NlpD